MTTTDLLSEITLIEAGIENWYEEFDKGRITRDKYMEVKNELTQQQLALINHFDTEARKDELQPFLDFLLKEGYCDADVYAEPPKKDLTVIDAYIIQKSKTE